MTRASKEKARIYREATKGMSEDDKKNYDLLLELQNRFDSYGGNFIVNYFKKSMILCMMK